MRHMGNSGKLALITAVVALLMLVLTAITLEETVMFTFLGLVALAYVAALFEVLSRRRHAVAVAVGVGTSLTLACSLAFVSTWELAYANQSSIIGTPLPTGDPDNYFFLAGGSAVLTLLVLFLGAAWPAVRTLGAARRKPSPAKKRPASSRRPPARFPGAQGATTRGSAARGSATPGTATRGSATQGTAARTASGQRSSGSRAPARLPGAAGAPGAAAKRPASSASPVRKPAPNPGSKAPSRR